MRDHHANEEGAEPRALLAGEAASGRAKRQSEQRRRFGAIKPRPIASSGPGVSIEERPGRPALVTPACPDVDLPAWCRLHLPEIQELLDRAGAVRFRGFGPVGRAHFRDVFTTVCPDVMSYADRSSPRSEVEDRLYTSTDHPPDQLIRMHCELSYSHAWPTRVGFFCLRPADEGGETALADTRRVLEGLSGATRSRFAASGVRYFRDLRAGIGLDWSEVFGVRSREAVEQRCEQLGISCHWDEEGLQLQWTRPAIQVHPRTGELVWFNHASFFHREAVDPDVASALGPDRLPFWTSYGDGAPIERETFLEIESSYRAAQISDPWVSGDVVILDNLLTAHGRLPFRGPREIYVMMGAATRA